MTDYRRLRVALLGAGAVGSQVASLMLRHGDELADRAGARLELAGIAVRDVDAPRDVPLPRELRDAIAADLENRGVDVARLTVITAHRATWQDGAWGCPAPGKVYTQAIEEGYAVIVAAAGVRYDYRFGSGPVPKLCPPPGQR